MIINTITSNDESATITAIIGVSSFPGGILPELVDVSPPRLEVEEPTVMLVLAFKLVVSSLTVVTYVSSCFPDGVMKAVVAAVIIVPDVAILRKVAFGAVTFVELPLVYGGWVVFPAVIVAAVEVTASFFPVPVVLSGEVPLLAVFKVDDSTTGVVFSARRNGR